MIKCSKDNCEHSATHYPKIMVPAMGWPIELHKPIGAVLSLALCKDHAKEFSAKEFLDMPTPMGNETNKILFEYAAKGKIPPDFDRAYTMAIRMDCKEAIMLTENAKK